MKARNPIIGKIRIEDLPWDLQRLFPILLIYVIWIGIKGQAEPYGDEHRYLYYAENLTHGYFSPPGKMNLRNGPMYPLVLVPNVLLNLPLIWTKLWNAVWIFFAARFLFKTLEMYIPRRYAIAGAYLLAFYPLLLMLSSRLITESFSIFTICGFIYFFIFSQRQKRVSWRSIFLTSLFLAMLTMTKLIFSYVIQASLVFALIGWMVLRYQTMKRAALVCAVSMSICLLYLAYTYSVTGRMWYWSTNGGEQMYWMASPYDNEVGSWFGRVKVIEDQVPGMAPEHKTFYAEVYELEPVERKDAFIQKAKENMRKYPEKYIKNWVANIGRFLFGYPRSYRLQGLSEFGYMLPNIFFIVLGLLSLYPAYIGRRKLPEEIVILMIFILIYCGGASLLHASARYFIPVVPFLILWLAVVRFRTLDITLLK